TTRTIHEPHSGDPAGAADGGTEQDLRAAHRRARAHPRAVQGLDPLADGRVRDGAHRHLSQQALVAVAARGRDGMEHIGTYLNKRSSLSPREVEIGILVIARHWGGDYVLQAHIREGKKQGLTQATIDAILAGADPKLEDPHERAVHGFATAL